jgi:hypothetical protein
VEWIEEWKNRAWTCYSRVEIYKGK